MFSPNLYYPAFLTSQGEISQVKNSVPLDPVPYQTADVVTSSNLLWYQIQREQRTPRSLGRTCAPHPSHGSRPLWENHWQFSPDKKNHTLKCLNNVLTYWQTARHVFGCQTKHHTSSLRQRFSGQLKIQLPVNTTKGHPLDSETFEMSYGITSLIRPLLPSESWNISLFKAYNYTFLSASSCTQQQQTNNKTVDFVLKLPFYKLAAFGISNHWTLHK